LRIEKKYVRNYLTDRVFCVIMYINARLRMSQIATTRYEDVAIQGGSDDYCP
jgi:hypothetical protein